MGFESWERLGGVKSCILVVTTAIALGIKENHCSHGSWKSLTGVRAANRMAFWGQQAINYIRHSIKCCRIFW
jgi:hypothetical protein